MSLHLPNLGPRIEMSNLPLQTGNLDGARGLAGWQWLFVSHTILSTYIVRLICHYRSLRVVPLLSLGSSLGSSCLTGHPPQNFSHPTSVCLQFNDWHTMVLVVPLVLKAISVIGQLLRWPLATGGLGSLLCFICLLKAPRLFNTLSLL